MVHYLGSREPGSAPVQHTNHQGTWQAITPLLCGFGSLHLPWSTESSHGLCPAQDETHARPQSPQAPYTRLGSSTAGHTAAVLLQLGSLPILNCHRAGPGQGRRYSDGHLGYSE